MDRVPLGSSMDPMETNNTATGFHSPSWQNVSNLTSSFSFPTVISNNDVAVQLLQNILHFHRAPMQLSTCLHRSRLIFPSSFERALICPSFMLIILKDGNFSSFWQHQSCLPQTRTATWSTITSILDVNTQSLESHFNPQTHLAVDTYESFRKSCLYQLHLTFNTAFSFHTAINLKNLHAAKLPQPTKALLLHQVHAVSTYDDHYTDTLKMNVQFPPWFEYKRRKWGRKGEGGSVWNSGEEVFSIHEQHHTDFQYLWNETVYFSKVTPPH